MKYLGIYLTRYVQDLYEENYETLMKDNQRRTRSVKHPMFMDKKTQYCQDISSSQIDL